MKTLKEFLNETQYAGADIDDGFDGKTSESLDAHLNRVK